ncbi:MAG: pilus assembly protein TadG-related protein [Pseudolabrys sp.]
MSWSARIRRRLADFARAKRGNVAITFAFATLPVIGFVGAAVDFSHANSVKAALQAALDSTALMVAKDAPNVSSTELNSKARAYFTALFTRPEATIVNISATYSTAGGSNVLVTGKVTVPTTFMAVLGRDTMTVDGSSTTKWGSTRLRVALALDVTGSMASAGKMTALKSATKNLLNQLKAAAGQNGDVYVSIVPFNKNVNVGRSNYAANWIDWDDWEDANGSWQTTTTCTSTSRRGKSRCSSNQTWVPASYSTWNGCITDRDRDYDQKVTAPNPADATLPAGQASTLFPAEQYASCPAAMMGLSYNWTAMNSLVDALQPVGMTNQPIGLVWAWQSLVGGGPLTAPAKDADYKYQEIIILMSDGMNTQNRWYSQQTPIDNRMYQTGNGSGTCANIKAAGITIYSVQVNTDGDPTSTVMRNCASSTDKFWMITSANDLNGVFSAIGTNLTQLRVAK